MNSPRIVFIGALVGSLSAPIPALAHTDFSFGVNLGPSYAPPPVYYAPPPVYQPAPSYYYYPPQAYSYYPPPVYGPPYGGYYVDPWQAHEWHEHHGWRQDDDD